MNMTKDMLEEHANKYNRSKGQSDFLYDLLKGDMDSLHDLEDALKYHFLSYCPGDSEECDYVLARYRTHKYIDKMVDDYMNKVV